MMDTQQQAMNLETHIITWGEWQTMDVPDECRKTALQCNSEGIPTAVGYTEETGWFVLCSGQGPMIAWIEKG
jgi:hypothetical protein